MGMFRSCFLKLFFVVKNKGMKENRRTYLVPGFFVLKKHRERIKH